MRMMAPHRAPLNFQSTWKRTHNVVKMTYKRTHAPRAAQSLSRDIVMVQLPGELVKRIDVWAAEHDGTARGDAICALVEIGLAVKDAHAAAPGLRARAASLAGQQIDQMSDTTATAGERRDRKSRLTDGPATFRDVRRDRPERTATHAANEQSDNEQSDNDGSED
jgi:hypothetical protein